MTHFFPQIRARRLAKLGNSSTSADTKEKQASGASSPAPAQPVEPLEEPKRSQSTAESISKIAPATPQPNPSSQSKTPVSDSTGNPKPTGSVPTRRKRSASEIDNGVSAVPSSSHRTEPQRAESEQDYTHRILTQIFRVTVDPHNTTSPQGHRLVFLPTLNTDLNDAGETLKLTVDKLDQVIIEACTNWPVEKPLMNYLLPCWKRAVKAGNAKMLPGAVPHVHEEAKRLCMSNSLFCLTMPELYE